MLHRRTVPTYFGGLPATHDLINDPVANGDAGPPAPGDTGKEALTGTYFVAFQQDATTFNINRGSLALAENTDFLDDIVHTSVPMPFFEDFTAGGGGDTQIAITEDVFVGRSGLVVIQDERNRLVVVVDPATLEPITDAAGVRVLATDIRDTGDSANVVGTEATGFHTNPIVRFTPTIPAATNYRLIFTRRGTVTAESDPVDATGDMGFLAGLVVRSAPRPGAGSIPTPAYTGIGTNLSVGTVLSQLQELADELGGLAAANIFTGVNTFSNVDGVGFGADPTLITSNILIRLTEDMWIGGKGSSVDPVNMIRVSNNDVQVGGGGASSRLIYSVHNVQSHLMQVGGLTPLTLTNTGASFGEPVEFAAPYVHADADGSVALGEASAVATRYARRFSRVHSSWLHFREDYDKSQTETDYDQLIFGSGTHTFLSFAANGILRIETGGISGDVSIVYQISPSVASRSAGFVIEYTVRIINSLADLVVEFGVSNIGGISFEQSVTCAGVAFDTAQGDSFWTLVGASGGATTRVASSVAPVVDTWVRLTIVVATDGSAELFVNGVSEATLAAAVVGTSIMGAAHQYCRTIFSNVRGFEVDRYEFWQAPLV